MMFGLAFLSLAMAQQSSEAVIAINPDNPLTWTLEYPLLISPHVDGYYGCLRSREIKMGPDSTFEAQHRSAIVECAKKKATFMKKANAVLADRGLTSKTSPSDVQALLDSIELIHVARGKDLDDQMNFSVEGNPYGQRVTASGVVMSDAPPAPTEQAVWKDKQGQRIPAEQEPAATTEPAQ